MAQHNNHGGKRPQSASQHHNTKFENPYNFVAAIPRDTKHEELGDHAPAGHHRYHLQQWSGRLSVTMTTVTPLLIPDQPAGNDHKTFGIRTDASGNPYLPPTSIKGALRAAYEAITNSRMGILDKHDQPLALRMAANESINMVPCRIVQVKDKHENLLLGAKLLPGQATIGTDGKPAGQGINCLMYAAWLRRYRKNSKNARDKHESVEATKYPDGSLPQHGDRVFVQYERKPHRSDRFAYLQITKITKATINEPMPCGWTTGWVFVSGPNIKNKHEERVFLETNTAKFIAPIPEAIQKRWTQLTFDYKNIHKKDLNEREGRQQRPNDYLGDEPGQTGFSRQVYTEGAEELKPGTLCYAKIETDASGHPIELKALYPVSISRDLYESSPAHLLPEMLKPASFHADLSPADRVFGWVKNGGHGQHKGQLRIGPVTCDQGQDAIERVGGQVGLPLAILGAPKPAQARFYAAKDGSGTPYDRGTAKDAMYRKGQGLRGRKVYPHHKLAATAHGYWNTNPRWDEPLTTETGHKVFREWLRAGNTRDSQNRSITAWVKPGSTFHFDIDITNLSTVEVGALLWLLTLDDDCHFRLGSAKPLGFGSTKLELSAMDLRDGAAIRAGYIGFGAGAEGKHLTSPEHAKALIEAYKQALCTLGTPPVRKFEEHPIIKAFLNASRGGNVPVHYPRTTDQPNHDGQNFKWFVANEKSDRNRHERYNLPSLTEEYAKRGLLILKE